MAIIEVIWFRPYEFQNIAFENTNAFAFSDMQVQIEKPNHLFLLNHGSDRLLLSFYFELRKTEKCYLQIILDLRSSHQISY